MEKLRMYNPVKKEEEKEPLKTPLLTIRGRNLVAVEEDGTTITYLYDLKIHGKFSKAKETLSKQGYRTDWAKWTNSGAFRRPD